MNRHTQKIHIALPVLDESGHLPAFLEMLGRQSERNFLLHVCVNQPEEWWDIPDRLRICLDNQKSISLLKDWKTYPVRVIDRASRGKGWIGKKHGVGWARKTVMDSICEVASDHDIIVSLDADTLAGDSYLESIRGSLNRNPDAHALAVPYYHHLTGDEKADRAILRYEIYMRNYDIHLLKIRSPYAFTALGSAMAFPVWAYKKIGGITAVLSGEDFYFLQKMVKSGRVLRWNPEKVFPAARFSDRVYFGTGPAMRKGSEGNWESYPIYHYSLFELIEKTYELFPFLYKKNVTTPLDDFLNNTFKEKDIWNSLRNNYKSEKQFLKACHVKIDGLRILQFLKQGQKKIHRDDEICLIDNLKLINPDILIISNIEGDNLSFASISIEILNQIRDRMVEIEEGLQNDYADIFDKK
jgi:hypothetical protein